MKKVSQKLNVFFCLRLNERNPLASCDIMIRFVSDWNRANADVSFSLPGIVIARLRVVTCRDNLHTRHCHFVLLRPMACLIQALFICSHRSPFLTHSTLMAPFTPLSASSPGSTMKPSWPPCLPDRLLSVEKPTARGKPFVTYLRGGWMVPSFDLYLAIFL